MRNWRRQWRELWLYWVPPAVVLLIALTLLLAYRSDYAGRRQALDRRIAAVRQEVEDASGRRARLERMRDARRRSSEAEAAFLSKRLGRRSQRLTEVLREVKSLASRAGIQPNSLQYTTDTDHDHGLERVGMNFTVDGSYPQVRTFIHLLEVSDSFLVLQDVSLNQVNDAGTRLRIQLQLATYFEAPGTEAAAAGAER